MAIIGHQPFPALTVYRNASDIEKALQNADVAVEVEYRGEGIISVAQAISKLELVGNLLQLTCAGSHGFPCSVQIVDMMSDYQDLIKNSDTTAFAFVQASIKALNLHVKALGHAENNDLRSVGTVLSQCEALAAKMVVESEKLVKQSTDLTRKSVEALKQATSDNVFSKAQREAIEKTIIDSIAKEKLLEKHREDLIRDLERELEDEKKADKLASRAQKISDVTAVISVFVQPIVTLVSPLRALSSSIKDAVKKDKRNPAENQFGLFERAIEETAKLTESLEEARVKLVSAETRLGLENNDDKKKLLQIEIAELKAKIKSKDEALKQQEINFKELQRTFQAQAENAQQRASRIMERRVALQQQLRQANMDLAETVSRLEHLESKKDNMGLAVGSLQVSIKMLGQITTIFKDTRRFWEGVKTKCQNLENSEVLQVMEHAGQEDIMAAIKSSGLDWLTLGKNTNTAYLAMQKIDTDFDKIMCDLPTESEAAALIKPLVQNVLKELAEDNTRLTINV